jgi:hypothetical protein
MIRGEHRQHLERCLDAVLDVNGTDDGLRDSN